MRVPFDLSFAVGDSVKVVDVPSHHGDHWASGLTGVVKDIEYDIEEDNIRCEVLIEMSNGDSGRVLHYNIEKGES